MIFKEFWCIIFLSMLSTGGIRPLNGGFTGGLRVPRTDILICAPTLMWRHIRNFFGLHITLPRFLYAGYMQKHIPETMKGEDAYDTYKA